MADIDIKASGSSATVGDAIFLDSANTGSGTGVYDPFLTLNDNDGTIRGFNTDSSANSSNPDIVTGGGRTNSVKLSEVPIVVVNGVEYYQFRVDLNENNSPPDSQIAINTFQIYTSSLTTISQLSTLTTQNKVYDMDASSQGDVRILLDEVSKGSGTDDYSVLVPVSKFTSANPATDYLYLYVEMGERNDGPYEENAGFEEWKLDKAGVIKGIKFEDKDGDGTKDAGEGGLGGYTIFIDGNKNGQLDAGERSTVTNSDGSYTFYGVALGEHRIDEVTKPGETQTTGNYETVTLREVGKTVTVDPIGNTLPPRTGCIEGEKFYDKDADGCLDDGECGIEGWKVYLYEVKDGVVCEPPVACTTTDKDGKYKFSDVPPGCYKVVEETPEGWSSKAPTYHTINLDAGEHYGDGYGEHTDFLNYKLGCIEGEKYYDKDADGCLDESDCPLAGWKVYLYEVTDGVVCTTPIACATTDEYGKYKFSNLEPGCYKVVEDTPEGWSSKAPTYHTINLGVGEQYGDDYGETTDFLNYELGCISGVKYEDKDADGCYDETDCPLAGWKIYLYEVKNGECSSEPIACVITNEKGEYKFPNLEPGCYKVVEDTPEGWSTKQPTYHVIDLQVGDHYGNGYGEDTDFLNYKLGCVEGTKYYDKDADGCLDEGECPIAGWKVYLYEVKDGTVCASPIACTYTDEYGNYKFANLEPGCYKIVEDQPEGWNSKGPVCYDVTVESGKSYGDDEGEHTDFLNYEYACIVGEKYYDADRSGDLTEGDCGIAGWKITLYKTDEYGNKCGEPIACTTTNSYGSYKFGQLDPGRYVIVEEQPKGWASNAPTERYVTVEAGEIYGDDDCEHGNPQPTLVENGEGGEECCDPEETDFFNYKLKACIDVEKYVSVDGGKTWWDADCKTGPVADKCDKILFKFVVKNTGEVDLCNVKVTDNKLDLNGSASGTAWKVGELGVGECETKIVAGTWKYGQQSNVACATGDAKYGLPGGEDMTAARTNDGGYDDYYIKTVNDKDAAYYWGIKGVHDTSYWKSKIGQLAWDGKANPNKYCLPKKDLLQDTNGDGKLDGLRIGDFNFNGKQDKGECTLVWGKAAALSKLCSTATTEKAQLEKALVTAWLNMRNGNSYDDRDGKLEECEPGYWIDQAIKYLKGCGSSAQTMKANWKVGLDTDGNGSYGDSCDVKSGSEILAVLKQYNKDGSVPCEDCSKPDDDCGCGDSHDVVAQMLTSNALT